MIFREKIKKKIERHARVIHSFEMKSATIVGEEVLWDNESCCAQVNVGEAIIVLCETDDFNAPFVVLTSNGLRWCDKEFFEYCNE